MSAARLVDFHCHLDLFPDHAAAFQACDRDEIFTLAVTTTPRAWAENERLASQTKYVRAALGLHPQLVKERANELDMWRKLLPGARYIGEVGLDAGPRFYSFFEQQKAVFKTILADCAEQGGKVLTVHSVRAATTVLDMIEAHLPRSRGAVVLHWFTGTKAEATRAVDLGCYFSINQEMLRNDRHGSMVSSLPLERLLTETDGPFTKLDGRDVRPADVAHTLEELARSRSMAVSELSEVILQNLRRLVS